MEHWDSFLDKEEVSRCGFVALLGASNSGKSTLMNRLVGTKISIVTHKVQTTRFPIRGITSWKNSQIIFIDMPGFYREKPGLSKTLPITTQEEIQNADIIVGLIDAERGLKNLQEIFGKINEVKKLKILAINKIDKIRREELLPLARKVNEYGYFNSTFMISALNGSGCEKFMDELAIMVPEGPWLYPEGQRFDQPVNQMSSEITREKIYLRLHKELPYSTRVKTVRWETKKDGSLIIEQEIQVEKESHRKIIIGHKGSVIKEISLGSRLEISQFLNREVHLFLFVKKVKWSGQNRSAFDLFDRDETFFLQ